jgi:uncharacterized OB-fold protein
MAWADALAARPLNPVYVGRDAAGPVLRAWRCNPCGHLSFGMRGRCPACGLAEGRETALASRGELETWTRVATREGGYVIGYALLGDGHDDQRIRVLGPVEAESDDVLSIGMPVRVVFTTSGAGDESRAHHLFVPDGAGDAQDERP